MTTPSPSRVSLHDHTTVWSDPKSKSVSYFARRGHTLIDAALRAELRQAALESGQNARLCLHEGPDELVHQMVIAQHAEHYNRPKKHFGKTKSWHMLEGRMAIVVFDESGTVFDRIVLDDRDAVLYRLPADMFHTNIPLTPLVIHEEILLGPFVGDGDRAYAPFSPDGGDKTRARDYILGLIDDLADND